MGDKELNQKQERAWQFVTSFVTLYETYHNHKENMAYAAAAAYVAAISAGLITDSWPPELFSDQLSLVITFISVIHVIMILFLSWQLKNRAIAAICVAGGLRLLTQWIVTPPSETDLNPPNDKDSNSDERPPQQSLRVKIKRVICTIYKWVRSWEWILPTEHVRVIGDVELRIYPTALYDACNEQTERGTGAVIHSRLVLWACWLFFVALVVKTFQYG